MTLPSHEEKEPAVQAMFSSIAHRYDLNNTLLSLGIHHLWKRIAVRESGLREGDPALDLCTGTADLAVRLSRKAGPSGRVIGLDLNERMLVYGRRKVERLGLSNVTLLAGNAESLQFCDRTFRAVTVAFGIRNVTDIRKVLTEAHRVLKPGGRFVCLEFSTPTSALVTKTYDFYSFHLLPWIGSILSGDRTGTYRYLPESIRAFHDPESLKRLMEEAGFEDVSYRRLSGGIVAIHVGRRPLA